MVPGLPADQYGPYKGFQVFNTAERSRSEGWKIHVAAPNGASTPEHAALLAELRAQDVPHKFVGTKAEYAAMTGEQQGKFITIYTNNADELRARVGLVNSVMRETDIDRGQQAPTDYSVGKATIRYGASEGKKIYKPETLAGREDPKLPSAYMDDVRDQYKPDHIRNPFDPQSGGTFDGYCDHLHNPDATKGFAEKQAKRRGEAFDPTTLRFEPAAPAVADTAAAAATASTSSASTSSTSTSSATAGK